MSKIPLCDIWRSDPIEQRKKNGGETCSKVFKVIGFLGRIVDDFSISLVPSDVLDSWVVSDVNKWI